MVLWRLFCFLPSDKDRDDDFFFLTNDRDRDSSFLGSLDFFFPSSEAIFFVSDLGEYLIFLDSFHVFLVEDVLGECFLVASCGGGGGGGGGSEVLLSGGSALKFPDVR